MIDVNAATDDGARPIVAPEVPVTPVVIEAPEETFIEKVEDEIKHVEEVVEHWAERLFRIHKEDAGTYQAREPDSFK